MEILAPQSHTKDVFMVTEFMMQGNLQEYLLREGEKLEVGHLIEMF
jgi:hypothetical protein